MKKYTKPELNVVSFRTQENIAALKEYYYETSGDNSYKVSLFTSLADTSGVDPTSLNV